MTRQGIFLHLSALVLMMLFHGPSHGEDLRPCSRSAHFVERFSQKVFQRAIHEDEELRCNRIVLSGEEWPPFSYYNQRTMKGLGIDLARMMFYELNIPVTVVAAANQSELEHLLRRGRIDLLVSTLDIPRYEKSARLVYPPYFEEPIGIAVPKGQAFEFSHWDHLMGRTGITTENRQLGREFDDYSAEYLDVESVGNINSNYKKLSRGEYDYIIGSTHMLQTGMSQYGHGDAQLHPTLVSADEVFFAFSEESPCKRYAPYLRARIAELKNDPLMAKLMRKHMHTRKHHQPRKQAYPVDAGYK